MESGTAIDFIQALEKALRDRYGPEGYTVQAREPADSDLAPGTMWVSNDGFKAEEGMADMGYSTSVTLPVYVSTVLDPPWDVPSAYQSLRRRRQVIGTVQKVIREFSGTLPIIFRGENLLARKEYEVAYIQLDVQEDLEADL